jgi:serine/threonine protein kinase
VSLPQGTRFGPYEVLAPVGAGGMGEVHRARDTRLDRDVAIKVLLQDRTDAGARERFQREARAVAALQHPHICAIYDIGETSEGRQFLVMELLQGETLQQRLARGALEVAQLVEFGIALADALSAAHATGILHRDIKPSNIFLTARGPKLLDFGLAKSVLPNAAGASMQATVTAEAQLTDPGGAVGTLAYMSPEQLRGEALDERSDLFSFGLVLYEMATGLPAFTGPTNAVISAAILHQSPAAPSEVRGELPPSLDLLILKTLEKDLDERCQTAAELRADLKRTKRELESHYVSPRTIPTAATPNAPAPMTAPAPDSSDAQMLTALVGRHRVGVATAAVAILLAVAGSIYIFSQRRAQPPAALLASASTSLQDLQVTRLTTNGNASRPAISPDGKYVAYIQQDGIDSSMWIRQTATTSNVRIVPAERGVSLGAPTVTPDGGSVDFVRIDRRILTGASVQQLWRVPFLGGAARRLIDNIWSPVGWSPDGRHLAFVRTNLANGSDALVVAEADGSGERVLAERRRPSRFFSSSLTWLPMIRPAWSLDGRLIALIASDVQGNAELPALALVDVRTGSQQIIALGIPENAQVQGLAWLDEKSLLINQSVDASATPQLWRISYPDGRRSRLTNDVNRYVGVSVTADRGSFVTTRSEIRIGMWVGGASASNATEIVPSEPFQFLAAPVAWAIDHLVYLASSAGRLAIMSVSPGGGSPREIVSNANEMDVTPDGQTVVFTSAGSDGRSGVWKVDIDGRHAVQLVPNAGFPVVTPDGRQVIFLSTVSGVQSPWIVSIDGGKPTEVVRAFANAGSVDISPDGKSLVFSTVSGQATVCDLPTCTTRRTMRIRASPRHGLRWTPDGKGVAYVDSEALTNLWVQPLGGGAARQLTRFTDGRIMSGFAWSRDGERLAISRAIVNNDIVLFNGLRR